MSEENLEIVRTVIDAYDQGDSDAAFRYASPELEYDLSRTAGPYRGVYGLDQARGIFEEFVAFWASSRVEPHEYIEVGDDVVVPWTAHMVGRDGIEVRARVAWTFTVRDGEIQRICVYQSKEEALEAAGGAPG
jgi:ketosteroid isomerase-like protein